MAVAAAVAFEIVVVRGPHDVVDRTLARRYDLTVISTVRGQRQQVINGLGTAAATHVDPRMQRVDGKWVCLVSCQRAAESVYLTWKGLEKNDAGDFYVRTGPGSRRITDEAEIEAYIAARWG